MPSTRVYALPALRSKVFESSHSVLGTHPRPCLSASTRAYQTVEKLSPSASSTSTSRSVPSGTRQVTRHIWWPYPAVDASWPSVSGTSHLRCALHRGRTPIIHFSRGLACLTSSTTCIGASQRGTPCSPLRAFVRACVCACVCACVRACR